MLTSLVIVTYMDCPVRLESPTRSLHVSAPEEISVQAANGPITVSSLGDLRLESLSSTVSLQNASVSLDWLGLC